MNALKTRFIIVGSDEIKENMFKAPTNIGSNKPGGGLWTYLYTPDDEEG